MENVRKMNCTICETRRPRRFCPAVRGDICAMCCGTARETSVDCPLDCSYLQEAHRHERAPERDPDQLPNQDVEITERFLEENGMLFAFLCRALAGVARGSSNIHDADVREALDAMARTYRTLESGLVYETRPANLLAAGIQQELAGELDALRRELRERAGVETVRDADILGVLVLLQRLEFAHNNGRPRSRAFLDFLAQEFSGAAAPGESGESRSGLILPG
jgi:hypothetical protein